jgi:hypothetical protein
MNSNVFELLIFYFKIKRVITLENTTEAMRFYLNFTSLIAFK